MSHELSRRVADEFMQHFPRAMQLSSNYNTLYPMLKRGLSPALYTPGMFWENESGGYGTVAMRVTDTQSDLFCNSIDKARLIAPDARRPRARRLGAWFLS